MDCSGPNQPVTHKSPELKSTVKLTWMAPELENDTDVQFFFTVVVNKTTFWVKQAAEKTVKVKARSGKPIAGYPRIFTEPFT